MLPVVEIFGRTIQGEGRRMGYPSYFVRLGRCNFSCSGFGCEYTDKKGKNKVGCDSWYAVDPSFKEEWTIYENFHEIVAGLEAIGFRYDRTMPDDLVITGGEPTLYWENKIFQDLLAYFISRGVKVTIETNASRKIEFTKPYQKEIMFSMSVKLSNSGEPEHRRINIEAISGILENTNNSYFKFVVDKNEKTIHEIQNILKEVPYFSDVFLMPMGENKEELEKNQEYVADLCNQYGFIYSPRIHIVIWGDKRGV